jgi:cell division ATPase FtsA
MFSRISPLPEMESFLVIDIWSYLLKVMVCKIVQGSIVIEHTFTRRQSRKNMYAGDISDLLGITQSIEDGLRHLPDISLELPKKAVFLLHPQESIFDSFGFNYVRSTPNNPITMEEIDKMVGQTEGRALQQLQGRILERIEGSDADMRIASTCLTSLSIDGQKVTNPLGFTGKNIKLQLLNIFVPQSRTQALMSIARMLNLEVISLIPAGIALSKLFENQQQWQDALCLVDFWYSKTVVTAIYNGELLGTNTIPYGTKNLEDALAQANPYLSVIQIEAMVSNLERHWEQSKESITPFFFVLFDLVRLALEDIKKDFSPRSFYITGGLSQSDVFEKVFTLWKTSSRFHGVEPKKIPNHMISSAPDAMIYWLALSVPEISLHQGDPIIRLIRSVIYRYE